MCDLPSTIRINVGIYIGQIWVTIYQSYSDHHHLPYLWHLQVTLCLFYSSPWKITIFKGKPSINGPFSMAMLIYWRVTHLKTAKEKPMTNPSHCDDWAPSPPVNAYIALEGHFPTVCRSVPFRVYHVQLMYKLYVSKLCMVLHWLANSWFLSRLLETTSLMTWRLHR